jgi:hypothetical protein
MFVGEYDYIFYISPEGLPIEDNSVRETNAEYRDLIDFTIRNIIKNYPHRIKNLINIPPYLSVKERVEFIIKVLGS